MSVCAADSGRTYLYGFNSANEIQSLHVKKFQTKSQHISLLSKIQRGKARLISGCASLTIAVASAVLVKNVQVSQGLASFGVPHPKAPAMIGRYGVHMVHVVERKEHGESTSFYYYVVTCERWLPLDIFHMKRKRETKSSKKDGVLVGTAV